MRCRRSAGLPKIGFRIPGFAAEHVVSQNQANSGFLLEQT
jgi:hypothetical protein